MPVITQHKQLALLFIALGAITLIGAMQSLLLLLYTLGGGALLAALALMPRFRERRLRRTIMEFALIALFVGAVLVFFIEQGGATHMHH